MPLFIALTSRGLGSELAKDARALGLHVKSEKPSWINFDCSWQEMTDFIMASASVTRVLRPLGEFSCYKPDDLYFSAQKIDFTKYIEPTGTLRVRVVGQSQIFKDTRFVALKIKDGVVDQFSEKFGKRPDVAPKRADLPIHVILHNEKVSLNLDVAGYSLSQRGYRVAAGTAPLREHLAAGLIGLAQVDFTRPVLDPMCGSGTLVIEAIGKKLGVCLRDESSRLSMAFSRWKNVKPPAIKLDLNSQSNLSLAKEPLMFYGSDHHPKMIAVANENAERAGIRSLASFKQIAVSDLQPPTEQAGTILVNPPYGERLGDAEQVKELYQVFGKVLRERFKGWTAWILSGDAESTEFLRMKSSVKFPIVNGTIDCRWIKYEIY